MPKSKKTSASKNSIDYDKVSELDQTILRLQQRAEIKRVIQKGKVAKASPSLTEEFFEGVQIVQN